MRKILMTTYGSYGDLNPYLGMARVLLKRGDQITVATHTDYREQVERIGARFVPMKPGFDELGPQEEWAATANSPYFGTEFILNQLILPYLEDSYKVIKEVAADQDLIISHMLTFASPIVGEELGIPWVSSILQPLSFYSAHDPPVLPILGFLPRLKWLGPRVLNRLMRLLCKPIDFWLRPIAALRKKTGLPAYRKNFLLDFFSPTGTLALFPAAFTPPQPDWPVHVKQIGFPLFDEETTSEISPGLEAFLTSGSPPVVFTLGTAVVRMETPYFEVAYKAVKSLGLRAVFLAGANPKRLPPEAMNDPSIYIGTYEPFSRVFPRGLAIVHQCGIGTTSQALASGRPQVLVPFAHDQPDNARKVTELGAGVSVPARRLSVARLTQALQTVTQSPSIIDKARELVADLHVGEFSSRLCEAIDQFSRNTSGRQ